MTAAARQRGVTFEALMACASWREASTRMFVDHNLRKRRRLGIRGAPQSPGTPYSIMLPLIRVDVAVVVALALIAYTPLRPIRPFRPVASFLCSPVTMDSPTESTEYTIAKQPSGKPSPPGYRVRILRMRTGGDLAGKHGFPTRVPAGSPPPVGVFYVLLMCSRGSTPLGCWASVVQFS